MTWSLENQADTRFGQIAWGTSGDGPDLVLAHGWPWSSFSWHRVIPELEKHYRVHWFDMVGYGKSSKEEETSLDVQGELFAYMLDVWSLENPIVWAHDFGGAVSLRAHLLHGTNFSKLVLMNVVAISPWGSEFFDHVGRHVPAFLGLPAHIHEAIVRAYIGGALVRELSGDDKDHLVEPWLTTEGTESFYRQFAMADDRYTDEFFDKLNTIRCPVFIVWGEDDPWIPVERGKKLHSFIPGSGFTVVKGTGHLPQLEVPEEILETVYRSFQ